MTSLLPDAAAKTRLRSRRFAWRRVPGYAFLTVFALFSVFPLYFMLVSSTNSTRDVLGSRMTPGGHLIDNLVALTSQQDIGAAMISSFLIAVGTTVLALIVCGIAGYGFEIYHSRGKDVVMAVLMLAMMIPFAAIMIPLFRMFAEVGMVNSLLGTPWWPEVEGGVLFLEDVGEHPYRIERMLLQLHYAGVLARQKAVVLGQFTEYKLGPHDKGFSLAKVIERLRGELKKVPVLTALPFGHLPTKVLLPVGRKVDLLVEEGDAMLLWGHAH